MTIYHYTIVQQYLEYAYKGTIFHVYIYSWMILVNILKEIYSIYKFTHMERLINGIKYYSIQTETTLTSGTSIHAGVPYHAISTVLFYYNICSLFQIKIVQIHMFIHQFTFTRLFYLPTHSDRMTQKQKKPYYTDRKLLTYGYHRLLNRV